MPKNLKVVAKRSKIADKAAIEYCGLVDLDTCNYSVQDHTQNIRKEHHHHISRPIENKSPLHSVSNIKGFGTDKVAIMLWNFKVLVSMAMNNFT